MTIKRAKTLDGTALDKSRTAIQARSDFPSRDRAILMLSTKAGLRAAEIAGIHVEDVLDANGRLRNESSSRDAVPNTARPATYRSIPTSALL